ncbi:hypothetical protein RYX36_021696, partial [Vicia faba]
MSSRGNQGKHSRHATDSSSQSRQSVEPEHLEFDNTRFIGPRRQARSYILAEHQIWPEKNFTLKPQGDYHYFMDDMERRKWGVLLNLQPSSTLTLFENFMLMQYRSKMFVILIVHSCGGELCHLIGIQLPVHFKRCDMNTKARLYTTLLLCNIKLRSHTLTIHVDSTFLLHYMIKGWHIDVAQVISNEIRKIAISDHSLGSKAPLTLAFSALIMGLCRKAGVDIPNVATKRISSIVNEDYVLRDCMSKLA